MRTAFLITPTYATRAESRLRPHPESDGHAVREALAKPGYDFDVFDIPTAEMPEVALRSLLVEQQVGVDDTVLLYVSAACAVDDAGKLVIALDGGADGYPSRVRLATLHSELVCHGIRCAAVVLDLVFDDDADGIRSNEALAAACRAFESGLLGCSMLCAVQARPGVEDAAPTVSPFTSMWLAAMEDPASRNMVGVVLLSRVMEVLREQAAASEDLPHVSMVAGKRDMKMYSTTSPTLICPPMAPTHRASTVPLAFPQTDVDDVFAEGDALLAEGSLEAATDAYKRVLFALDDFSARRADVHTKLAKIKLQTTAHRSYH